MRPRRPLPTIPAEKPMPIMTLYLLFFLPFLIFGTLAAFVGALNIYEYTTSQSWPETRGQVTHSEIRSEMESGKNSCHCRMYWVAMSYAYQANGQTYYNNRLNFDDQICFGSTCMGGQDEYSLGYSEDEAYARRVLADYPVGREFTVYFDPANPQNAVLERETPRLGVILMIGGIVAVLVSTLLIAYQWTKQASRTDLHTAANAL